MSAKFTKGDSTHTTVRTAQKDPPPNVRSGNTMNGMPGHIDAGQTKSSGGMKGGKAFGPHKGGPIGEKGGSGAKSMGKAKAAPGTMIKNYKSASTGKPGALKGNGGKMEKLKARTSAEGGRKSWSY